MRQLITSRLIWLFTVCTGICFLFWSARLKGLIKRNSWFSFASSFQLLDCYLYLDNGKLTTRLYDKRDDFNFPIVNFPFLSSNIPSAPAYGVYISQLICYARACSNYQDFMERGKVLTAKLLSQGIKNQTGSNT